MGAHMHELNETLFLLLNATGQPSTAVLAIRFLAQYAIWLVPLALIAGWLRGNSQLRMDAIAYLSATRNKPNAQLS